MKHSARGSKTITGSWKIQLPVIVSSPRNRPFGGESGEIIGTPQALFTPKRAKVVTLPPNRNLNNPILLILKDSVGLVDLVEAEGVGDQWGCIDH